MKLPTFINADLIWNVIKFGAVIGIVAAIYFGIKNIGKQEEVNKNLTANVQVLEKKIEVKNEVQKTINRVVTDPAYRDRVRSRYDSKSKD